MAFDKQLLKSEKIAGNRDKAEPIIRAMFKLGESMDQQSQGTSLLNSSTTYHAQDAAAAAFKNGYTDLGVELYQAATNKTRNPLLVAFPDSIDKADMTRVLMLAQGNMSGVGLAYVIDNAILHLERTSA